MKNRISTEELMKLGNLALLDTDTLYYIFLLCIKADNRVNTSLSLVSKTTLTIFSHKPLYKKIKEIKFKNKFVKLLANYLDLPEATRRQNFNKLERLKPLLESIYMRNNNSHTILFYLFFLHIHEISINAREKKFTDAIEKNFQLELKKANKLKNKYINSFNFCKNSIIKYQSLCFPFFSLCNNSNIITSLIKSIKDEHKEKANKLLLAL